MSKENQTKKMGLMLQLLLIFTEFDLVYLLLPDLELWDELLDVHTAKDLPVLLKDLDLWDILDVEEDALKGVVHEDSELWVELLGIHESLDGADIEYLTSTQMM